MFARLIHMVSIVTLSLVPTLTLADGVANVSIEWAHFDTEILSVSGQPVPQLTFSDEATFVWAARGGDLGEEIFPTETDTDVVSNWTAPTRAEVGRAGWEASALASDLTVLTASTSFDLPCSIAGPFFCWLYANSEVRREASISIDGPGVVVFSVPYMIDARNDSFGSFDNSTGSLSSFITFADQSYSSSINLATPPDSAGSANSEGIFSFAFVANAAGQGTVSILATAGSQTTSVVPVPQVSTWVMVGLGLGALLILRWHVGRDMAWATEN